MSREKNAWGKATIGLVFLMCVLAVGFLAAQGGPPSTKGGGGGGGGGGGEVEGYGNNLSVPTAFAEGVGLTGLPVNLTAVKSADGTGLRPAANDQTPEATEYFCVEGSLECVVTSIGGIKLWPQQTSSWWRASVAAPTWNNGGYSEPPYSVIANWGDNLVNQSWTTNSIIRVEVGLYQNNIIDELHEYEMKYLTGTGSSEMWGTTKALLSPPRLYRTVYTSNASLTIEKLEAGDPMSASGNPDPCFAPVKKYVWDNYGSEEVELSSAPTDSKFNAEVNVSGNLIYGYNWTLNRWVMPSCNGTPVSKEGFWRLTFTIEPNSAYNGRASNATITANDLADSAGAKARPGLGVNSTVLVIKVNSTRPTGGRRP